MEGVDKGIICQNRRQKCDIYYPNIVIGKTLDISIDKMDQLAVIILANRLPERYCRIMESKLHTKLPKKLSSDKLVIICAPTKELMEQSPATKEIYNKWNDQVAKLLLKSQHRSLHNVLILNINLKGRRRQFKSNADRYFSSTVNFKDINWDDTDRELQQVTSKIIQLLLRPLSWPLRAEESKEYLKVKESQDGTKTELVISIPGPRLSVREDHSFDEDYSSHERKKRSSEADVQPQLRMADRSQVAERRFGIIFEQSGSTTFITPLQLAEALPGSQRYSVQTQQPLKYPTTDTGGVTVLKDDDEEQVHLRRQIHDPRQTTEHEQHTSQDNKPENKTLIVLSSTHNIDETNRAFRNNCDDKEDIHYLFIPVAHVTQPWTDNFKLQLMERLPSQNTQYRLVILIVYADTIIDNDGRRNIRFEQQDTCLLQQLLHIFTNTNDLVCGDPHHRALILASPLQQTQQHFATPLEPVQLGTHSALVAFADSSQGLGGDGLTFINRIVEHLESTHAITSLLDQTNEQVRQNSQGQQVPVYHTNFDGEVQLVHR